MKNRYFLKISSCSVKTCVKAYHIKCGVDYGNFFRINADVVSQTDVNSQIAGTEIFESFCEKHSNDFEEHRNKKRGSKSCEEIETRQATIDGIYKDFEKHAPDRCTFEIENDQFELLKGYWIRKRRQVEKFKPLIDEEIIDSDRRYYEYVNGKKLSSDVESLTNMTKPLSIDEVSRRKSFR